MHLTFRSGGSVGGWAKWVLRMYAKEFLKTYKQFLLLCYVYLWDFKTKKGLKKTLLVGNGPQNEAHLLKSEKFTPLKHRHIGVYPEAMAWNVGAAHGWKCI